jgi:hypothetical protein
MKLWILGLASALLLLSNPEARASVLLDWGSVPSSQRHLKAITGGANGLYTTGSDFKGIDVTVQGTGFAPEGLHDPKIDPKSHPYPAPVLSAVADFKPMVRGGNATVEFTIDFFGFKQGVKDVSFELFNIDDDHSATKKVQDVVTFKTAGLTLTGSKDNVVSGNTVTGIADTGPASTGGPQSDVAVHSGNLPLHKIVFDWTEKGLRGNKDFLEEIAIGNITFTPVPEVGQLVIGLATCLLGGLWLWLHQNRRKTAPSIP